MLILIPAQEQTDFKVPAVGLLEPAVTKCQGVPWQTHAERRSLPWHRP